jgi:hypothetical protein
MYGDSYLRAEFSAVNGFFSARGGMGLMTVFRNCGKWDKSNVLFRDGGIIRYDKASPDREMEYIDYGLGLLTKAAFELFSGKEAFDLADVYSALAASGRLLGYEVYDRFYEIGSAQGLAETDRYLSGAGEAR